MGGWAPKNFTAYNGTARSLFSWSTTDSSVLLGVGTDTKMYVGAGTNIYDITPIRATFTSPATDNCISTTTGSTTVVFTIAGYGGITGDFVTISGVTGNPGGIPNAQINAEKQIEIAKNNTYNNFFYLKKKEEFSLIPLRNFRTILPSLISFF